MANYIICIPSYKRSKLCNEQTLEMLHKNKINPKLIYVYVADKEEYNEYKNILDKHKYNKIIIGIKGISNQREFIYNDWPTGKHIILIDDDVKKVDLSLSLLFKSHSLDYFFRFAFQECKKKHSYIWGVYPVYNPFFRKGRKEISSGLNFIVGTLYGVINRPKDKDIKASLALKYNGQKEDVEISIRYFIKDGNVIRFNKIGFLTKYYNPQGGLGDLNSRIKVMKESALRLEKEFPDYGTIKIRNNGIYEFNLKKIPSIYDISETNDIEKNKTKKNKTKKNKTKKNKTKKNKKFFW